MDELVSAGVVGLSFGNLWICTLLVFSLRAGGRSLAAGYLLGRAAAIVALSVSCAFMAIIGFRYVWHGLF